MGIELTTAQVTLAAAVLAALTSLITLGLNIATKRSAELRKAHRDALIGHLQELGAALHETLATSHIFLKNRTEGSTINWREKANKAKTKLKTLRVKLRYPLWGLDASFKTISLLPDWIEHVRQYPEYSTHVIKRGKALGKTLDRTIRRCYMNGRAPNWIEVWRAEHRRRKLERAYRDFKDRPESPSK